MYLEIRITCQEGKLIRKLSDHSDKIKVHQSLLYFDNLSLKKNLFIEERHFYNGEKKQHKHNCIWTPRR